jgi:hypothetical protein
MRLTCREVVEEVLRGGDHAAGLAGLGGVAGTLSTTPTTMT